MSKIAPNKQEFVTIPKSRFNLGDSVQWSLKIPGKNIVFYGYIVVITWNHELNNDFGYWSYITNIQFFCKDGLVTKYDSNDDVEETDLKPWCGDGSDSKIDSGIGSHVPVPVPVPVSRF